MEVEWMAKQSTEPLKAVERDMLLAFSMALKRFR